MPGGGVRVSGSGEPAGMGDGNHTQAPRKNRKDS